MARSAVASRVMVSGATGAVSVCVRVDGRMREHTEDRRREAHESLCPDYQGSVRLVKARPLSAADVSPPVQIIVPSLI